MGLKVTHVLDESTAEDAVRQLCVLLRHVAPADEHQVLYFGARPPVLVCPQQVTVRHVPRCGGLPWSFSRDLDRILDRSAPQIIHTWGLSATARISGCRGGRTPLLATLSDADEAQRFSDWHHINPHSGPFRVTCPSPRIADRLIGTGVAEMLVGIVPWGVDTATLRRPSDTSAARDRLGLPQRGSVLLTASPPSRAGGQFLAAWAAAILHQVRPHDVLVIPGLSQEEKRLRRLLEGIYCPQIYFPVGYAWSMEEMLAAADLLVFAPQAEVPNAWLSWAMAAGAPIAGSQVPAVMEAIVDGQTGVLAPPWEPHLLATRIRGLLDDTDQLQRCVENARNQAVALHNIHDIRRLYDEFYGKLAERHVAA